MSSFDNLSADSSSLLLLLDESSYVFFALSCLAPAAVSGFLASSLTSFLISSAVDFS